MALGAAGYGTLDETLEITTWQQLGFHQKPGAAGAAGGRQGVGAHAFACKIALELPLRLWRHVRHGC